MGMDSRFCSLSIDGIQKEMIKYLYTDFARFEVVDEPNPIIDEIFKEVE